jgi:Domain of unknown function (DUF4386)
MTGENRHMVESAPRWWERYAWLGGAVFVIALVAETVVAIGIPLNQDDSAGKIATVLADHHGRQVLIACLSIVYAPAFVMYLSRLHDLFRQHAGASRFLLSWVLMGGVLFITLHGVSDIGITGMLGAKVAAYSAAHDHGLAYSLYLLTFALDSVGDIFASLFAVATGVLILRTGLLPRWLAWMAIVLAPCLFAQAFGLGGVIGTFGLVLDLIGFVLLLVFVLVSSLILFARAPA